MSITSIIRHADELLRKSADARQVLEQRFKEVAVGRSSVPNNEVVQAAPAAVLALKQIMGREGVRVRPLKQKEVHRLLQALTTKVDGELDAVEFEDFLCKLVKYGAVKGRKGAGKRWVLGLVLASAGAVAVAAALPYAVPTLAGSALAANGMVAAGPVGAAVAAVSVTADDRRRNGKARRELFREPADGDAAVAGQLAAERVSSGGDVDLAALVTTAPATAPQPAAVPEGTSAHTAQPMHVAVDQGTAKVLVSPEEQPQEAPQVQVPTTAGEQSPQQPQQQQKEQQEQQQPQQQQQQQQQLSPFAPATPTGSADATLSSASESSSVRMSADASAQLQRPEAASAIESELPPLRTATTPPAVLDADSTSEAGEPSRRSSKDGRVTKWIQRTLSSSGSSKRDKRISDDASARNSVDKSEGSATDKMKDWLRRSVSLTKTRTSVDTDKRKQ